MISAIRCSFSRMLADLIAGGRFQNQSEVLRAGLRLLEDREYGHDQALEDELAKRLDSPSSASVNFGH